MIRKPRPDLLDSLIALNLSLAVGFMAAATAPFEAYREAWPEEPAPEPAPPADGDFPEGFSEVVSATELAAAPTVGPIRPSDAPHATDEVCRNCRFYHAENSEAGACRFGPPAFDQEDSNAGCWPVTRAADWCGQFRNALVPEGYARELH